jgi:hypothetical protein
MNIKLTIVWLSALVCTTALANEAISTSPYIGQQKRSIKALSAQEIADLQASKGMGLSKVAELNHVPGPSHVIELADKLALSARQKADTQTAFDVMAREAKRIGTTILTKESTLEQLFVPSSAINSEEVRRVVSDIAKLQGELRFVHLNAHMAMSQVLSPQQIAAYDLLRGYGASDESPAHPHHH